MTDRILVLDDDVEMCELLKVGLSKDGYGVETFTNPRDALIAFDVGTEDFAAVIADLELGPHESGLKVCERMTENRPDIPVIMITAFGSMENAIAAMRAGAYDFLNKPLSVETLTLCMRRALQHRKLQNEVRRLREEVQRPRNLQNIVGNSPAMKLVFDVVARVGQTDASVLLTGESGTGKELVAQALHNLSPRKERRFVAVNCAAVPESLLPSELFGHVKGAFTDAKANRRGVFLEAEGGTLLLDEVAEMPLEMQAKILRALQERRVRPVGSDTDVAFECRFVAATNRNLEAEVTAGRFRQDLYYRLNVVHVHIPPLRDRGDDVLLLAQHFLEGVVGRLGKNVTGISPEAAAKLMDYPWPGNVRELQNSMERAVALTRFDTISVDDLPERIGKHRATDIDPSAQQPDIMPTLDEVERRYIEKVLKMTSGNKAQAARVLGLDRRTLYRRIDKLDVRPAAKS